MKLIVSEIRQAGSIDLEQRLDAATLLGEPHEFVRFFEPLTVRLHAQMTSSDIVVSGKIGTQIALNCGRCLESVNRRLNTEFQQVYPAEGDAVDLSGDLRETILLDLPMNAVCSERCKGLCPTCGKNRNVVSCRCAETLPNPRWESLKKFPFK